MPDSRQPRRRTGRSSACDGLRSPLALCLAAFQLAACDVGSSVFVPRGDVPPAGVADVLRADAPPTEAGVTCAVGRTNCGGVCVDVRTNVAHCGGCGQPCAPMQTCLDGVCQAPVSLRFELQWDVPGNVDLQVVTPCNTTVGRPAGPPDACGGALDRDDTTGVGPENVSFANARRGNYFICAVPVAISSLGLGMTTVTVNVFVGPSLMTTVMRTFNAANNNTACAQGSQNFIGGFVLP